MHGIFLDKNVVFIDSMELTNSSLDKLVKNLPDEDFKNLVEEFGSENLGLLIKKVLILMSTWTVLKDLKKRNACWKMFFSSAKKVKLMMMVKYQTIT